MSSSSSNVLDFSTLYPTVLREMYNNNPMSRQDEVDVLSNTRGWGDYETTTTTTPTTNDKDIRINLRSGGKTPAIEKTPFNTECLISLEPITDAYVECTGDIAHCFKVDAYAEYASKSSKSHICPYDKTYKMNTQRFIMPGTIDQAPRLSYYIPQNNADFDGDEIGPFAGGAFVQGFIEQETQQENLNSPDIQDIELVMQQCDVTRPQAIAALDYSNNDIINAIMLITSIDVNDETGLANGDIEIVMHCCNVSRTRAVRAFRITNITFSASIANINYALVNAIMDLTAD